jgi:hypothetical protein
MDEYLLVELTETSDGKAEETQDEATNAFSAFCKFLQSRFTRSYLNNKAFGRHLRDEFQRRIESVLSIN